jgi:hypothetical protein
MLCLAIFVLFFMLIPALILRLFIDRAGRK